MNKITLAGGAIIIGIVLFIGGVLMGQANAQEFQPGSMMGGYSGDTQQDCGGMGGGYSMMGSIGIASDTEISVTEEDAVSLAQEYLDNDLPGTNVDDHADPFPGYYTIHVEQDGEVVGMLSVNEYNGQVFLHHWHGKFIEMTSEVHD